MKSTYMISLTTENALRVLQRISTVFTRNRINIEQLNVFETQVSGISHFHIVTRVDDILVKKIVKQLAKIIEVIEVDITNRIPLSPEA
ncbi:acetolactate synthase small subunit [Francisellaceae bacterium]|nr:acetolactate synthase small subunit [Francisellaceae bacterium]